MKVADEEHGVVATPFPPPRHTIDLSLAPRQRYKTLASAYRDQILDLTTLYDELLLDFSLPESWLPNVKRISKMLLRKVHNRTQTEELRGIAEETGISMYLLVAFNVVLDLLMGCTSGGARTLERGQQLSQAKMTHFRTLDWEMPALRKVVVHLDFIQSKSNEPTKILASSITYVGFVGVLTGVRPALSMSLNFRALHDASTKLAHFRFYFHHLLVLLGLRPSIAAILRSYLIGDLEKLNVPAKRSPSSTDVEQFPMSLAQVSEDLSPRHTTAAYLIFCDGKSTISIDKDYGSGKTRGSKDFIVTTNHDVIPHNTKQSPTTAAANAAAGAARRVAGLDQLLEESRERLDCISRKWDAKADRLRRQRKQNGESLTREQAAALNTVSQKRLEEWVSAWPTTNESTHYAAIMDPTAGTIPWAMVYPEPVEEP